jgi:hypothetical protein
MQPNFLATPQSFVIQRDGIVGTFFEKVPGDRTQILNGSVVTSTDAPGSVAYVAATNGKVKGKPSQRVLLSLHGPKLPVMSGTLEFTSLEEPEAEIFGALAGLALQVLPLLLGSQADSSTVKGSSQLIPIFVGPSSVSQGPMGNFSAPMAPEGIFDILSTIARTVVPVIAPVALDVAQQLLTKKHMQLEPDDVMFDFGGLIGDIVKVAAPIAGAALTELGKRF